jgi:hypothetical protein
MSNMYAIKEETLSALGDAIRSKVNGTSEVPAPISKENVDIINGHMVEVINFPDFVKTVKVTGHVNDVDMSNVNPQSILHNLAYAPGAFTGGREAREADGFTVVNPNWAGVGFDYEIIVNDNALTLITELGYNTWGINFTFNYYAVGLDENGNEFKYTPLEMAQELEDLNTNPIQILPKIISRAGTDSYFSVTKEDLDNITKIGSYTFYQTKGLNSIELPDTLQEIQESAFYATTIKEITFPASLNKLGNGCFTACSLLHTIRILNNTSVITCPSAAYSNPFSSCKALASIYIPSKLYNAYYSDGYWNQYKDMFITVGEWVLAPNTNAYLSFNQSKEISIELLEFATTPQFSITSSNENVVTISNISINEDNTLLTFTINSLAAEGNATIEINIIGENTYNYSGTVKVYETLPESSYEVVPQVEGASYGFALREDDGYWESQNFKQGNSAAVCQINISNPLGRPVYIDCISYGESSYDYGVLGNVGQELLKTNTPDGSNKKSFKSLASADIQTVEYLDAAGDCFIQVKYLKDSGGDHSNDSLRFTVRFGE